MSPAYRMMLPPVGDVVTGAALRAAPNPSARGSDALVSRLTKSK